MRTYCKGRRQEQKELNQKAFSLLELIVSVAVLSVGITLVLQAISFSARLTGFSGDLSRAIFISEDVMQDLEFKETKNLLKDEPLQVSGSSDKFNWLYLVSLQPDLELYALDYSLSWTRSMRKEGLHLVTYFRKAE